MKLAIVICGQIGSGKSTLSDLVASEFGFKSVSFGNYVRHMVKLLGSSNTRDALQDLGDGLFRSRGPSGLLQDTLEYFTIGKCDSVVIDGVRHSEILTEIRQTAETTIAFYLEVSREERYRRHQARLVSRLSFEEFQAIDSHPVEGGIDSLIDHCDLMLDASHPVADVQRTLLDQLPLLT